MTHRSKEHLRQIVIQRLESWQQAGVMQVPKARAVVAVTRPASSFVAEAPAAEAASPSRKELAPIGEDPMPKNTERRAASSPASSLFDTCEVLNQEDTEGLTLEVIQQQVAGCTRCSELAQTRTQTVFGVGNPKARLCFLGEAPGADEDRLGEPFVGRGGQLLTKIIEACKLKREDVYILNMLKCRPPGNRNPLPTELSNCREYLDKQLDLIQPEFICCVGAVAAQNLLGTTVGIGKLRGKIHQYRGAKVVCTYHPAFLLRSPSFKKETWDDMKFLMREMGTPVD
jgi:DNA polymerase